MGRGSVFLLVPILEAVYTDGGPELSDDDPGIDIGLEHERNLSRTRRFSMTFGGGAQHVDQVDPLTREPIEYWTPTGYGSLQYDFARTWSVAGDYRRGLSYIHGIVPQTYISHTASLRAGGYVSERLEGSIVLGYGNGQGGASADDQYDGYTGTLQLRTRLAGGWSAITTYNHYQYRLTEDASLFLGVPTQVHRNSIWAGLSWSAPIYRQYMRGSSR